MVLVVGSTCLFNVRAILASRRGSTDSEAERVPLRPGREADPADSDVEKSTKAGGKELRIEPPRVPHSPRLSPGSSRQPSPGQPSPLSRPTASIPPADEEFIEGLLAESSCSSRASTPKSGGSKGRGGSFKSGAATNNGSGTKAAG